MKNTEKDYRDHLKNVNTNKTPTNQDYNKSKPQATDPGVNEGKPSVILPIIDKSPAAIKKEDAAKEAEGNNYTAAENDHQTNSTL